MKHLALTMMLVGLSLSLAGCLRKDTVSTIYLRPNGAIDWIVLESNVRSDENDPAKRANEEADYLNGVAADRHPAAKAFRALGGWDVRTSLIRRDRPYGALVEGRFDSLTSVVDRWLTACGIQHEIYQRRDGNATSWGLQMYVEPWVGDGPEPAAVDEDVCDAAGLSSDEGLRITIETGRFTRSTGFTLVGPDTVVLDEDTIEAATTDEAIKANRGWLVLSLNWTTDAPSAF